MPSATFVHSLRRRLQVRRTGGAAQQYQRESTLDTQARRGGSGRSERRSAAGRRSSSGRRRRARASSTAASSAAPGSTSPTSPASVRFMPTSTTTAPGLTMSGVTSAGTPDGGDEHVGVERVPRQVARVRVAERHGRVRLLQQVRHRLADDVAAADHDGTGAVELDLVLLEQRHHPARRRGDDRRPAEVQLAGVHRMEAVDVLRGSIRPGSPVPRRGATGSGSWTRIASTSSAAFSSATFVQQLLLRRLGRQPQVGGVEARLDRSLVLQPDVDLGGGIVADEHGHEADVAERRTSSATSARMRSASGFPFISVAAMRASLGSGLCAGPGRTTPPRSRRAAQAMGVDRRPRHVGRPGAVRGGGGVARRRRGDPRLGGAASRSSSARTSSATTARSRSADARPRPSTFRSRTPRAG